MAAIYHWVANTVIVTDDIDEIWRRILGTDNRDITCPAEFVNAIRDERETIEDAMEQSAAWFIAKVLRAYKAEADEEGTRT